MKINRVLGFAAVAILAGMSAATAKAQDPGFQTHDPAACAMGAQDFDGTTPVSVTITGTSATEAFANLCYDGTADPLTILTISFNAPELEGWVFSGGDVFGDNFPVSPFVQSGPGLPGDTLWTVTFNGLPGLTPDSGLQLQTFGLPDGQALSVAVGPVPEAGTLLLSLLGLAPLAWFGRKFRNSSQSSS